MIKLTALTLIIAAAADGTWDYPQQAELPSHEWLVVDHAPGTSFGLGVCVAGNSVRASAQLMTPTFMDATSCAHRSSPREAWPTASR